MPDECSTPLSVGFSVDMGIVSLRVNTVLWRLGVTSSVGIIALIMLSPLEKTLSDFCLLQTLALY